MKVYSATISQVNTQLRALELEAILSVEDVYYYADVFELWSPQRFPSAAVATPKAM